MALLTKTPLRSVGVTPTTFTRFLFQRAVCESGSSLPNGEFTERKTILFVGAPDSEKTSLINNFFNYIIGVEWNSPHRFVLKKECDDGPLSIDIFEIQHGKNFRISFSLTIVDVSVRYDTDTKFFAEEMEKFLDTEDDIQQLDMILFVASVNYLPTQSCESFLSFFGNDLKKNLKCLWAFPNLKQDLPKTSIFIESVPQYNFQMLKLLDLNGHALSTAIYSKPFQDFCDLLSKSNPVCLSLTKQVIEYRKLLDEVNCEIHKLSVNGTNLREKIKETNEIISDWLTNIEAEDVKKQVIENLDKLIAEKRQNFIYEKHFRLKQAFYIEKLEQISLLHFL